MKSQIKELTEKEKKSEMIFKKSLEFENINKSILNDCENLRENLVVYKEKLDSLELAKDAEIMEIIKKYESSIKEQLNQFTEKETECIQLTRKVNDLLTENHDIKNEYDIFKVNLDLLKKNHETLETSSNIERSELLNKSEEIVHLQKNLEEKCLENKSKSELLDEQLEKYGMKESECKELLNQLEIVKKSKEDLVKKLEINDNSFKALLSTNAALENSNSMFSKQLQEKSSELETLEEQKNVLTLELKKKEESYKVI